MSLIKNNKLNNKGFTLIELIVVMAVFVVVIMITGDSFNRILTETRKLTASEESNIEGVVGLEIMRHDLEQTGYGLPWISAETDLLNLPDYNEAASTPHSNYNDGEPSAGSSRIPRAFVAGQNIAAVATGSVDIIANTDYLGIKATNVGMANAAQRWSYVTYSGSSAGVIPKEPTRWAIDNIPDNSGVILLRRDKIENDPSLKNYKYKEVYAPRLIYNTTAAGYFYQNFPPPGSTFTAGVSPQNKEQQHIIYGIDDGTPSMPFNRVDYFVARPQTTSQMPSTCAPNTGILYKGLIKHSDNEINMMPVLDCVADMQIVFGWDFSDTDGNGVDTYSNASGTIVSGSGTTTNVQDALGDAAILRERLKLIKVYILAQDGRKDTGYTSPATVVVGDANLGETSLTKTYDLNAAAVRNYRWKVYRIISRPKNLPSNQ